MKTTVAPEVLPTLESEFMAEPAPAQTKISPQPGNMVCVSRFSWLECQGAGEATYAKDMHGTDNKISSIG